MTTPSEQLRTAAETLRTMATEATPGPWRRYGMAGVDAPDWEVVYEGRVQCDECDEPVALAGCTTNADAAFIALMDPTLAGLLADWLDSEATRVGGWPDSLARDFNGEPFSQVDPAALALAEHINGRTA